MTSLARTRTTRHGRARPIVTAAIGNVLEWYDYAIFGYLVTVLGKVFYPDESVQLLATFATFGVGFVMRPLGGLVLGHIGDVKGRRVALIITVTGMGAATFLIGLIPSYQSIGVGAPVLLLVLRLCQGFCAGGEWGGSTVFMVEHAQPHRRGVIGSLQQVSVNIGLLIGALVAASLTASLSSTAMLTWGWRIPFLAGVVLVAVGAYLRLAIGDTPSFQRVEEAAEVSRRPLVEMMRSHARDVLRAFGLAAGTAVFFYIFLTYLPTYLETQVGLSSGAALAVTITELGVSAALIPVFGWLSDKVGRKPLIALGCLLFAVVPYPLFALFGTGSLSSALVIGLVGAVLVALINGPVPTAFCELFPTRIRYSALSVPYSLGVAIFGGFAPFIATLLIDVTGQRLAPTFYVIFGALIGLTATLTMPRRRDLDTPDTHASA